MVVHDVEDYGNSRAVQCPDQCLEFFHLAAGETAGPPAPAFGTGPWFSQYEAVTGLAHRDLSSPLPCQDAALAGNDPRPWLLLADGAGSSAVSEIGARCVVNGLNRLLHTLERPVAALLDGERTPAPEEARQLALPKPGSDHRCWPVGVFGGSAGTGPSQQPDHRIREFAWAEAAQPNR